MSKSNTAMTWNELTPEQVDHFFRLCANRADNLRETENSIWTEFAKYLFAANAGAAAGLFLLQDSSGQRLYLAAFSLFCLGTAFVGLAWFAGWRQALRLSAGWTMDFNALMRSAITFGDLDDRSRARQLSFAARVSRIGMVISFALLLAGGVVAAKAFWLNPTIKPVHQPVNLAAPTKP